MVDVVVIGNVCFDEGCFLREDGSSDIHRTLGGAGYFSSVGASLFAKTGVIAKVGEDYNLKNFNKFSNININGIQKVEGEETTVFRTIFHSLDGKNRTISGDVPKNLLLSGEDILKEYSGAKIFHIATNEPEIQIELIKKIRAISNAKISIDTIKYYADNPFTKQAFDLADIAIIEDDFYNLMDSDAPTKIIKHGKFGVDLVDGDKITEFKNKEIVKNVTDKTGAGDIFAGSLVGMLSKGKDIKKAIPVAMKTATESIKDYGVEHLVTRENELS